jgi:hypothetical protein
MNSDLAWRLNAEARLVAPHFHHNDADGFAAGWGDDDGFIGSSSQYEHASIS